MVLCDHLHCLTAADTFTLIIVDIQWRRQLWGTGARAPSQLPTISFLVYFAVKLAANYPSIM